MAENEYDPHAVLQQIMALHGALEKIRLILMRGHLANCIPNLLDADERIELKRTLTELEEFLTGARRS